MQGWLAPESWNSLGKDPAWMDRHVAAGEVQPVVPSTTRVSIIIFIELWDRPGISANGDDWVTG